MSDIINLNITHLPAANVNVPRVQISGQVVDSSNQSIVLGDFTGPNTVIFPNVLSGLSQSDRQELMMMILGWLVRKRFGV